jgi:site-specific recombinase XerD
MLYLEGRGYAATTRERLLAYYKVLIKYAGKQGITRFTLEMGKEYLLKHHKHQWTDTENLTIAQNYLQRHILILHEFQEHGKVVSERRIKRFYHIPRFEAVIDKYLCAERDKGIKESTIKSKRYVLNEIFEYFESKGIPNTKSITPACIYGFLASKSQSSVSTREMYQYLLRKLIKYLHKNELCKDELAKLFPVISTRSKNAYPSYFKPEEITRMLKSIDIAAPNGKRDYLAFLLAAGLGIRRGDICSIKLKDIDWDARKIEFTQDKTEGSVSFTISDEIFYALLDYVKNERPDCELEELLVSGRAPVRPFTGSSLYQMMQKYLIAANIPLDKEQKHGPHAMRSSLASNMLRDGISVQTISNVLDHKNLDTTIKHYIKIDLEGLRKSALEVPVQ